MVKCCKENMHKNYSKPQTLIWSTLPETYGIALGTIKEEKTNIIIHEVYSVKSQEPHRENRLCHLTTHAWAFPPTTTKTQTIYRIQQKLDLSCNTVCSSSSIAISGWQHVVQENPCQKHPIFGWIGFIMTFLPSTLSPFSREAHMWK